MQLTRQDRIRALCAKAISAREDEWEPILDELQSLLREYIAILRKTTIPREDTESVRSSSDSKAAD